MVDGTCWTANGVTNDAPLARRERGQHNRRSSSRSDCVLSRKQLLRTDRGRCRVYRIRSAQTFFRHSAETNVQGKVFAQKRNKRSVPNHIDNILSLSIGAQGTLDTKEYVVSEIMNELGLSNEKLCVLAALLGNYLLPDKDLKDVYKAANIDVLTEVSWEALLSLTIRFCKSGVSLLIV